VVPRNRTTSAANIKWAPEAEAQLLTIQQTAERLGASENHVYRLIAAGDLRAVDIAQRGSLRSKTRVRSDDLAAYIDQRTRQSA
jgi:excisionase family DNA binding protein